MHNKKGQEKGYRVEKTMDFFCYGYPIFCHRGGDLFLTLRGGASPPFPPPLPMCGYDPEAGEGEEGARPLHSNRPASKSGGGGCGRS